MKNWSSLAHVAVAFSALLTLAPAVGIPTSQQAVVTPMTPDVVKAYDAVRPEADYIKRVVMIPMRDGVKLYTVIVMKKGTSNGPLLLSHTPYDAKGSAARTPSQKIVDILPAMDAEFVEDNYIRVYQDIRCRFSLRTDPGFSSRFDPCEVMSREAGCPSSW